MRKNIGFIRKAAIVTTSALASMLSGFFAGCALEGDSPAPVPQETPSNNYTVSDSERQELRESLFEHYGTLTKEHDAHLFQDSSMTEKENSPVAVRQTMEFGALTPYFMKDDIGNLGVFLYAPSASELYTLDWEFVDGFTSRINANGDLPDLLQEDLNIGGKNYRITKAGTQWLGGDVDEVVLDMITSKVAMPLNKGGNTVVSLDSVQYDVTVHDIRTDGSGNLVAQFDVNGELTPNLHSGETYTLANGQNIGVLSLQSNSAEFGLGAQSLSITDSNIGDDDFSGTVSGKGIRGNFNNNSLAKARIKGSVDATSNTLTLDRLAYMLSANTDSLTDVFVAPSETLSDNIDRPGSNLVEVGFDGLKTKKEDGSGNLVNRVYSSMDFTYATTATGSSYTMTFTSKEGLAYNNVDFIENVGTSATDRVLEKKLVMTEGTGSNDKNITAGTQFVLSGTNDFTHILRYDSIDTNNRRISFTDLATGTRDSTYDANTGEANLAVGGVSYKVFVDESTGNIAVDQNGDGKIDGSSVAIVDRYGAKITVPSATQHIVTANVSTSAGRIDGSSVDEVVDLEFCMAGTGMDVTLPAVPRMYQGAVEWKGQTRYGVKATVAGDFRDVALSYPEIQEEPVAYLLERD